MLIRLAGLVPESIVDGPGLRFAIFVQGCPHRCEGCHNPETHDFGAGRLADTDRLFKKIRQFPLVRGVTFSGGEPFCQAEPLAELGKALKSVGYHLMSYSGYTFEELVERAEGDRSVRELLERLDLLVDGRFVLAERSLELKFRGSRNQRILDIPKSLTAGKAVEAEL
ncbi:MAG: anaerobic ribonucleoside-triphosphate reductase activating protein [Bacteroides sp.]|nr:anaerobic ribonucleoside-triphosphate reductase activating protein [Roseburia sp.]MCM1461180.1 anaerobic ribonucleoside-triphosphate reductase activating protein [Bacteroides sp.]